MADGRYLEDAYPPSRLVWLARHVDLVSDAARTRIRQVAAHAVVTFSPKSALYAKELLQLLAFTSTLPPSPLGFKVRYHHLTSKSAMPCGPENVAAVETAIRSGSSDIDLFRLYHHMFVQRAISKFCRATLLPQRVSHDKQRRLTRLLKAFAIECTFKVHGDASLHNEIVTCMLPAFMSCLQAHLETPYQRVASSFPSQVNDMVRPILEMPINERLQSVKWQLAPVRIRDVILVAGLLAELVGLKALRVLTHATLCLGTGRLPQIFVRQLGGGLYEHGIRHLDTLFLFHPESNVCDCMIQWLQFCSRQQVTGTENTCELILHDATDTNPLRRYLQG